MIDEGLSKLDIDKSSLRSKKASAIHSYSEHRFLMKNVKGHYGLYLLNELQGRGTDLLTKDCIESCGGLYLIIADVFSARSEE